MSLIDKTERSADHADGGRERKEGGKETTIQVHGKFNYMIQVFIGKGTSRRVHAVFSSYPPRHIRQSACVTRSQLG